MAVAVAAGTVVDSTVTGVVVVVVIVAVGILRQEHADESGPPELYGPRQDGLLAARASLIARTMAGALGAGQVATVVVDVVVPVVIVMLVVLLNVRSLEACSRATVNLLTS